jgi:hypothetical protein
MYSAMLREVVTTAVRAHVQEGEAGGGEQQDVQTRLIKKYSCN